MPLILFLWGALCAAAFVSNAMPCYHPLIGVDVGIVEGTGKRSIKVVPGSRVTEWNIKRENILPLPCGKCIGCRLERSRQWAIRCLHEASLYESNLFLTLTFREACPLDGTRTDPTISLHKHHFQRFMKRLRAKYSEYIWSRKLNSWIPRKVKVKPQIRYFHCGEYGEGFDRPHHHACLFNIDFPDKYLFSERDGNRLYRSATLEELWPHGYALIGDVTFSSAAYVARYIMKKINGPMAEGHYKGRVSEYCTMSRRPGLSTEWFNRFNSDLYPKDFVIVNGHKCKIPKFYDKRLELQNKEEHDRIKHDRLIAAKESSSCTPYHLDAAEQLQKQRFGLLKRGLL